MTETESSRGSEQLGSSFDVSESAPKPAQPDASGSPTKLLLSQERHILLSASQYVRIASRVALAVLASLQIVLPPGSASPHGVVALVAVALAMGCWIDALLAARDAQLIGNVLARAIT